MTVLKWPNNNQLRPSFNSLFPDWMHDDYFDKTSTAQSIPAVNIKEEEESFTISLAAPGLEKKDFNISLDQGILTIESKKSSESTDQDDHKYTRKEYSYYSFSRSFTLPENIDEEKIDASYNGGELIISLPKKEQAVKKVKEIAIQ